MKAVPLERKAVVLDPTVDHVAVAKRDIPSGTALIFRGKTIKISGSIPAGQRFALADIKKGEFLRQYGQPFARSRGIREGVRIHATNTTREISRSRMEKLKAPPKTKLNKKYSIKTFEGFRRKEGRAGTRNYYVVIPTSMCASEVAARIASDLENENKGLLKKYSKVDGIVALPHTEGCGCDSGIQIDRLLLVLKGYANHPNVGGCLFVDLGCEQTDRVRVQAFLKDVLRAKAKPIDWITIQENGGIGSTVKKSKKIILGRLKKVNAIQREPIPLGELVLGTECGASDSFSGITANPVIGNVADKIIYAGGSAILTEVTEMVGVFNMLFPRFRSIGVARKFQKLLKWYTQLANKMGLTLESNLVAENIKGGLINPYIKNLGAVRKGGTTPIEDVVDYAEPITKKGLSLMQGPGNDPESVTGLVASGATVICFSTGKGAITGSAICPVIKIASNERTFLKLPRDIDFDASRLLHDRHSLDSLGEELLGRVIKTASGEKTWSEKWKQRQFQIWTAGKLSL